MTKLILTVLISVLVFSVFAQPKITSFSPTSGPINTSVTISGSGFSPTPGSNIVYFGSTQAIVTAASTTQLTVTAPAGATYKPISVMTGGLTGWSQVPFIITFAGGVIDGSSFTSQFNFPAGYSPYAVAVGDLDGDGKSDIGVSDIEEYEFSIFKNNSTTGIFTATSLANKVDLQLAYSPRIVIADLDGDGLPDMALADQPNNTLSLYQNLNTPGVISTSSFSARIDLPAPQQPSDVAVGDLDGDGKPDIITANNNSDFSIFQNISTPGPLTISSFATRVDFEEGYTPTKIALADLDGDGRPDIIVLHDNKISIYRNHMTGPGLIATSSFDDNIDLSIVVQGQSIAIGDIDGNGKPELISTETDNDGNNYISIYTNSSTSGLISFGASPRVDIPTLANPWDVAVGDLNGDGMVDIAVADQSDSEISVFINLGSPELITVNSFSTAYTYGTFSAPWSIAIADLDNDGKSEIVVANGNGSTISILKNKIIASLGAPPVITSFSPVTAQPGSTVTIVGKNFNALANNNIVFFGATQANVTTATPTQLIVTVPLGATYQYISETTNGLTAYSPIQFLPSFQGTGVLDANTFSDVADLPTDSYPFYVFINDLDHDGISDLVVATNNINVIQNTSTTTSNNYGDYNFLGSGEGYVYSVNIVDANGDGKPDIVDQWDVEVGEGSNASSIDLFTNTGSISQLANNDQTFNVDNVDGDNIAVGDLDGDGQPDLAVIDDQNSNLSIFINENGTYSQSNRVDIFIDDEINGVAIADIDGDGLADVIITTGVVGILLNESTPGNISFPNLTDTGSAGNNPFYVYTGDLDGDGKQDILAVDDNSFSILQNKSTPGNPSFNPSFSINSYSSYAAAIGDLDGDGKPDIAIVDNYDNFVNVFKNISSENILSTASFADPVSYTTGNGPTNVAIGDLNNDGAADMAVTNGYSQTVSILLNSTAVQHITITSQPQGGSICSTTPKTISVTAVGATNLTYQWKSHTTQSDGTAVYTNLVNNDSFSGVTTSMLTINNAPGTYVCVINGDGVSAVTTQDAIIASISLSSPTVVDGSNCGSGTITLTASGSDTDNYQWYTSASGNDPITGAINSSFITPEISTTTTYYVSIKTGTCESVRSPAVATIEDCNQLIVYNGISPGVTNTLNDSWYLENIQSDPSTQKNHVAVYNRWGDSVFEVDDYDNTNAVFTGKNKSGNDLATGIYFYKITFSSGKKTMTGYLSLKRD